MQPFIDVIATYPYHALILILILYGCVIVGLALAFTDPPTQTQRYTREDPPLAEPTSIQEWTAANPQRKRS